MRIITSSETGLVVLSMMLGTNSEAQYVNAYELKIACDFNGNKLFKKANNQSTGIVQSMLKWTADVVTS
jgi:hypothetical protein